MELLDGRVLSARVMEELKTRTAVLKEKGIVPGLAVIYVGDDPASAIYVRNKEKACDELGIRSFHIAMPGDTTQEALENRIRELNADEAVNGILVQLPLPKHLDEDAALAVIAPEKDADGFHILNGGKLLYGLEGTVPCTPRGIMVMLESSGIDLNGKNAVVIGRSNIVGKPVAMLLLQKNCTVTMCHSRTQDLAAFTRNADILVAAVGRPRFVTADMVKDGAVVIDVGINRVDGKVVGDVDFEAVSRKASFITPVPGGVGKMTVCMLMMNTVEAAEKKAGI